MRTANLIRDYGYLPKVIRANLPTTRCTREQISNNFFFKKQRAAHLEDGAELPMKFEPFPPHLLGKPVEEIDQFVYEKVAIILFLPLSSPSSSSSTSYLFIGGGEAGCHVDLTNTQKPRRQSTMCDDHCKTIFYVDSTSDCTSESTKQI